MRDFFELAKILDDDIKELGLLMKASECRNYALDRSYVRSIFSAVESILYAFRQSIYSAHNFDLVFSVKEQAFILERRYKSKNNTVEKVTCRPSLKDSILHNSEYYARLKGIKSFSFPKTDGWDDMKRAIKIRNCLTHPKSINEINITNDDLDVVIRAKIWFTNELLEQYK